MIDIDMDDFGELIRFWLQMRTEEEGPITTKLADKLQKTRGARGVTTTAIGYWLRGQRDIPHRHWRFIARHFNLHRQDGMTPLDALIADARRRWAIQENKRYYTPPTHRQARRTAA